MTTPVRNIRISDAVLERAANVIRCLGHPLRLRLVEQLEDGEHTVSELVEAAGVGQSAVSHQLAILRGRGVVEARRDGAFVRYRLIDPKVRHILDCIRACDCPPRERHAADSYLSEDA